jgi:hypothetical protein
MCLEKMVLMALQDEAQTTIPIPILWKQLPSFLLYIILLAITF